MKNASCVGGAAMPSSVIRAFAYDPAAERLDILFVSGRRYAYHQVPPEVAAGLETAASKGSYFNAQVRDRFRCTRLR